MTNNMRGVLMAGAVAAGMVPAYASAQDLSWSFSAEAAGDKVYVLYAQPEVVFGPSVGWGAQVQLGGHSVFTDNPGGTDNSWGLTPAAGVRWRDTGGLIEGNVGWAIADEAIDAGFDVFGGNKSGLYTALHTEYWGTGAWAAQGLAAYNWGADFLWSRGRLLKGIAKRAGGGNLQLGGQLTWEVQTDDNLPGNFEYQGTMVGPVLQVTNAGGTNWTLSAGYKHTKPKSSIHDNDTWYAAAELYLP